jgi:hypothetical protein
LQTPLRHALTYTRVSRAARGAARDVHLDGDDLPLRVVRHGETHLPVERRRRFGVGLGEDADVILEAQDDGLDLGCRQRWLRDGGTQDPLSSFPLGFNLSYPASDGCGRPCLIQLLPVVLQAAVAVVRTSPFAGRATLEE